MEIWADIKGYEGRFQISTAGNLKSINGRFKGEKLMSPYTDSHGYKITNLRNGKGVNRFVRIHTLVAETFINKPSPEYVVNHIDGNKLNNIIENLHWVTYDENSKHAVRTGLHITEDEALFIKTFRRFFNSSAQVAPLFNVAPRTIRDIWNGLTWGHI